MIKVNLIEKKKQQVNTFIMGVDIKQLNWKFIVPLILFIMWDGNSHIFNLLLEERMKAATEEKTMLSAEKKKLTSQYAKLKGLDKEISKFQIIEKKLKSRLDVVRKILAQKKNPQNIMLYISKNVPSDLWISNLSFKGTRFEIIGKSLSYKSIGIFLESLRSSIFFDRDLRLDGTKTEIDKETQTRMEAFKILGKVSRFE